MTRTRIRSFAMALLAVAAGVLVTLTLAAPAAAVTPCGKKVLDDWFDNGRVDRLYDLHCYEDAIDAIPPDLRDYADAEEVISRALANAMRGKIAPGGVDPSPGDGGNDSGGDNPGSGGGGNDGGTGNEQQPEAAENVSTTSSIPIPLLVLAGLALALLAAGGLGYVSRRRQAIVPVDDDANPPS